MMIRLAKNLARSVLGITGAVCLVLSFGLVPYREATAAALMQPPVCASPQSVPPEVQQFVDVQCAVHQAIFADDTDPTVGYTFSEAINHAGKFSGQDHLGRAVTFEAVMAVPLDLKTSAPDLYARGVEVNGLVGTIRGPLGSIPVNGIQMLSGGLTLDTGRMLVVCHTITAAQLDTFAVSQRIVAGPRVVDTVGGKSMPLSDAPSAGFHSLWMNSTDSSTLFGSTQGTGEIDWGCVDQAYASYDIAVKAAQQTYSDCLTTATEVCVACCALCTLWALGGGLTWFIVTAICMLGCVALLAIQVNSCSNVLNIALAAAQAQLQLALQGCGVIIVVP